MKRILIIEDDFYIRDIYNTAFNKAGYEVNVAANGEIGVDLLRTRQYDIVLLDIMMPKMTGIDVLKTARQDAFPAKDVPIFLITNLGQNDLIQQAFDLGADGYFLKSQLSPQELVSQVDSLLADTKPASENTQQKH